MKIRGIFCLTLICCICIAFTGGLFLGRNFTRTPIQLSTLTAAAPATQPGSTEDPPVQKLDINTATASELALLPGIGPTLAQRILRYRQEKGRFSSVGELLQVEGIGEGKLETILDYITVGG